MKITASRKDEILKRKAQYEEDYAAYEERQRSYRQAYDQAEHEVLDPIREYLERKLSRYSALNFTVTVRRGWNFSNIGADGTDRSGADVRIYCNEHRQSADDVALVWSYEVSIDGDGNIVKDSSSWSGLSATTEAQMNSLRQTVLALDFLNDVDWDELIRVDLPNYDDYYDRNDRAPVREDWDTQLKEAEIEELIGSDKLFKVKNWGESCPFNGDVWLQIVRETPSMYIVHGVPGYLVSYLTSPSTSPKQLDYYQNDMSIYLKSEPYRVRKTSVRPYMPFEIVDIDSLLIDTEA